MEKELKIIIAGTTCTGKSTMMYYLQQLLLKEGFSVELNLEGGDYANEQHFHECMNENLDERQHLLKDMTKITLKEMQMIREIKQNTNREAE